MADKAQRPYQRAHGDVERGFTSCYVQEEADTLFAKLETELDNYRLTFRAIERQSRIIAELHASIVEQGRKVLNATSEIGMSHAEYIEWVMGELGK